MAARASANRGDNGGLKKPLSWRAPVLASPVQPATLARLSRDIALGTLGAFGSLSLASLLAPAALANPTGAQVVNGQATLQQNGKTLTVTNTPGAIVNWQSFSIGKGETTKFVQQTPSSAILNRVVGQDPSQILGNLQSNGKVFLINPNGIVFGRGSVIDTAGMIASTLNISDDDFKKGKLKFQKDGAAGSIQVNGLISSKTGDVYIIAPEVTVGKEGIITSQGGNVVPLPESCRARIPPWKLTPHDVAAGSR